METHEAAPGIIKQSRLFVAEGRGEDRKVCTGELLKVGSAGGLWHQRVTVERQRDSN